MNDLEKTRKKWSMQQEKVLYDMNEDNQQQWKRINELLLKQGYDKLIIDSSQGQNGPLEASVI